jgi:3-phenylpropionate/cinnamic acid dioxygenase small subunit
MEHTVILSQARLAIEDVLYAYAEAVDSGDLDALARLLRACDLQLPNGVRLQGGSAIADHYRSIIRFYDASGHEVEYQSGACTPRTRHVTTNVRVTLSAQANGADVSSYFTAYQSIDGRNEIVAGGRYLDRFALTLGRWTMVGRRVLVDNPGDMSRHIRGIP